MRPETLYKAQIIEHVLKKGMLGPDDVLINELTIDGMRNRADLVIVNGSTHVIEVKTNSDSLARLGSQIEAFKTHFDKLTIACGWRHLAKLENDLPREIGLWVVDEERRSVKILRRGKKKEIRDPLEMWSFIPVRDIASFLRRCSIKLSGYLDRSDLCEIARTHVPIAKMRQFALQFAKKRYAGKWKALVKQYEGCGYVDPKHMEVFQWGRGESSQPQLIMQEPNNRFSSDENLIGQRLIPIKREKRAT